MCLANHKAMSWEYAGEVFNLEAGQFITSVKSIVEKCKDKQITTQKVRTALERFRKLGFLTIETTNKNSLVTIVNWQKYQGWEEESNKENNNQITNNQQSNNNQITTNNNDNNIKNDKNVNNSQSVCHNTLDNIPTPSPSPSPTPIQTGQTDSIANNDFDLMTFLKKLKNAIDYDDIVKIYNDDVVDNLIDLIVDIVAVNGNIVTIGGKSYPKEYIAEKLLTLDSEKIGFLVDKQKSIGISEDVRNPKRYMQGIILSAALNYNTEFQSYFNKTYYNRK